MPLVTPQATDKLNNPSHSRLHRVVQSYDDSPEGSFIILSSGVAHAVTGLRIASLNGVLKAGTGVVSGSATTSDLPEGTNEYYTNAKADARIAAAVGVSVQAYDADLATLAGLTATTDNFIVAVASAWASRTPAQVKTTLSLNNVENTALSTWAGSTNITTLGTIATGVWNGTIIGDAYITKSGNWTGTFDGQEGVYYLARANHTGTQLASTISNFDTQVRTSRLDQMAAPSASVSLNSQNITNLLDPTSPQDAATKFYVDALSQGLDVKTSVRVATTANITLSGAQTIDGVSAIAGDRVLVKDQSTGANNGIYVVASGSWTRATDADTSAEVTSGMFVFVSEGTTNADSGWVLTTNDPITLGSTSLTFVQFSGAGQITAGAGLTKTGNTIDAVGTSNRITVNADSIDIAATYVGQTSITTLGTIGTGVWNGTVLGVAYGGTGTSTQFTAGRVIFAGASGVYTTDAAFTFSTALVGMALAMNTGGGVAPAVINITVNTASGTATDRAFNIYSSPADTDVYYVTKGGQQHAAMFLALGNGTNSAPMFTWFTDPNTGMYRVTTDTIGFTTGGTLRFQISTTEYKLSLLTSNGFVKTSGSDGTLSVDTASYQTLDATLTALAAYNTNGILVQTAADTFAGRTLTGTANQLTVTNGDGVSGNPTISLPADVIIPTIITAPNTGLHILDTNASHDLILAPGSDLSADRTLTITTGDANRTLTISASATVSQDYSTTGNPQFATIELGDASNTTIGRPNAGDISIEGNIVYRAGGTDVAVADGGTNISSYAVGDILYASAATTLAKLAGVATGNALISGGVTTAPSWGKIALTTHVSGTLPVANGGTGVATVATDNLVTGNGTSAMTAETNLTFTGTLLNVGNSTNQGQICINAPVTGSFTQTRAFWINDSGTGRDKFQLTPRQTDRLDIYLHTASGNGYTVFWADADENTNNGGRMDFYGTNIYFNPGYAGNMYVGGNFQMSRLGDATGASDQYGSTPVSMESSTWPANDGGVVQQNIQPVSGSSDTLMYWRLYFQTNAAAYTAHVALTVLFNDPRTNTKSMSVGINKTWTDANKGTAAHLDIVEDDAARVMVRIKAAASQTANLLEFRNSSDAVVSFFDLAGKYNGPITKRVSTTASSATPTASADTDDMYTVTALAAGATFGSPTGTPTNGQILIYRIKDNGTARTLAWNAIYRAGTSVALPTTTVISKTMYVVFVYNTADTKWDLQSVTDGF